MANRSAAKKSRVKKLPVNASPKGINGKALWVPASSPFAAKTKTVGHKPDPGNRPGKYSKMVTASKKSGGRKGGGGTRQQRDRKGRFA